MPRNILKIFSYLLLTVFLTLGLSISFQSLLAAWTAPHSTPPICVTDPLDPNYNEGCNEPVNKGILMQYKRGPLYVNGDNNAIGFTALGKVGIGTITPRTALELSGDGAILATGIFDSGWTEPNLGAGTRMLWYPNKAAFRAGYVNGTQWNDPSIGIASVAFGTNTRASGYASAAFGNNTTASANYSAAFGTNTTASGAAAAFGYFTTAQAAASIVLGRYNVISGDAVNWIATDPVFVIGNGASAANPSNALTVLKNGKVGIGTTNPASALQINPAANTEGIKIITSNYSPFIIRNSTDTADLFRIDQNGNMTGGSIGGWTRNAGNGYLYTTALTDRVLIGASTLNRDSPLQVTAYETQNVADFRSSLTGMNGFIRISTADGLDAVFGVESSGNVYLNSNNPLKQFHIPLTTVIDGNLGIGTAAPTKKLDVNGTMNVSGAVTFGSTLLSQDYIWSTGSTNRVGFFDSNPMNAVQYAGGWNGNGSWGLGPVNGASYILRLGNIDNSPINTWSATQNTSLVLGGNLGVGVNSPTSKLDVNGGAAIGSYAGVNAAPANGLIISGNVGIGAAVPGAKLDVQGDTNISGDLSLVNNKSIKLNSVSNTTLLIGNYNSGGFAYGTGQTASLAVEGDVKGNRICIQEDCKATWTDIVSGGLPSGISGQTLRHNGTAWVANSTLFNDGTNVGIGTAVPNYKLEVSGTGRFSSTLNVDGDFTSTGTYGIPNIYVDTINSKLAGDPLEINFRTAAPTKICASANCATYSAYFDTNGNVGIGTVNPGTFKLNVQGTAYISSDLTVNGKFNLTGADVAEEFSTPENYAAGTVLVMGDNGYRSAKVSSRPYDTTVIGVVSDNPAVIMGKAVGANKAIVAIAGVIKVKVTDSNGKIMKGDLLTTSATVGYAMKATENKFGTIIGKALEDLKGDSGEIMTLINLQ